MTVYGLIPCGGKGTRLGLPFPKEMLPQKGFDYYNPLINHTADKMLEAGAEYLVFVHGQEYKQEIVDYYKEPNYFHLIQDQPGFGMVLLDFVKAIKSLTDKDQVLFGLPDSVYEGNPFISMLQHSGIVCGLFITDNPETKVDRLTVDAMGFQIKSPKRIDNQDWFWGVLKFDGLDLKTIYNISSTNVGIIPYKEIGQILNRMPHTLIKNGSYNDLGTWIDYNTYLSNNGINIYD